MGDIQPGPSGERDRDVAGDLSGRARLGAPLGFDLGTIRLEVDGRAAHESEDTWDATWLSATTTCSGPGAQVVVQGAVLTSWSVERFCAGLDGLANTGVGCAYLTSEVPNLTIRVESQQADAPIAVRIELTADLAGQGHWFAFPISRSEVRGVAARCREILATYPAHQVVEHS
jgi:hypothetical protein